MTAHKRYTIAATAATDAIWQRRGISSWRHPFAYYVAKERELIARAEAQVAYIGAVEAEYGRRRR